MEPRKKSLGSSLTGSVTIDKGVMESYTLN